MTFRSVVMTVAMLLSATAGFAANPPSAEPAIQATAPQAPAATKAAADAAAPAAQATTPANQAAGAAKPAANDSAATAKIARDMGFVPKKFGERTIYCHSEAEIGTKIATTRCMTDAQVMAMAKRSTDSQDSVAQMQRNNLTEVSKQ